LLAASFAPPLAVEGLVASESQLLTLEDCGYGERVKFVALDPMTMYLEPNLFAIVVSVSGNQKYSCRRLYTRTCKQYSQCRNEPSYENEFQNPFI
jgi:hypothetical protein